MAHYVSDGAKCVSADLPGTLRDIIGHLKDLRGLFIQKQMVVAKMATAHVPMEVFRFDIQGKHVRQQLFQSAGYFRYRFPGQNESAPGRFYSFCHFDVALSMST